MKLTSLLSAFALAAGIAGTALADDAGSSRQGGQGSQPSQGTDMDDPRNPAPDRDMPTKGEHGSDMPSQTVAKPDFQEVDANRDGKVSKVEASMVREGDFAKADLNRDGTLDRNEFRSMAWMNPASRTGLSETKPEFEKVDANKDGKLSKTETTSMLKGVDFAKADTNRNGFLDRTEYRTLRAAMTPKGAQNPTPTGNPDRTNIE